jgi:uncharacterized protein YcfJ
VPSYTPRRAALEEWAIDNDPGSTQMDKSMAKGLLIGGIATVVLGAGAVGGYKTLAEPREAEVLGFKEVTRVVVTPQQRCEDVTVRRPAAVQDEQRVAGTVIGGIAGGLLGSQIGGGSGRTLATVAGAAAGGYAGNRVQKQMQQNDTVSRVEQRCRTVDETSRQIVGYDVTYRLAGRQGTVRTPSKPGATLPVKNGQVVVEAADAATAAGPQKAPAMAKGS